MQRAPPKYVSVCFSFRLVPWLSFNTIKTILFASLVRLEVLKGIPSDELVAHFDDVPWLF